MSSYSEKEQMEAQALHWSPFFNKESFNLERTNEFLDRFGRQWDCSGVPPPDEKTHRSVLERAPNSATGVDGIPYVAWLRAPYATLILYRMACWGYAGRRYPLAYTELRQIFPPKKTIPCEDVFSLRRAPQDTRRYLLVA